MNYVNNAALRAKMQFLTAVKKSAPALYRAATAKATRGGGALAGLGITVDEMLAEQNAFAEPGTPTSTSTAPASWLDNMLNSTIDAIKQLVPVYVGAQQAQTCVQVNADRAKNGLPMIDCAAGGLAPQVSVGVSPEVKYVLWGGLGLMGAYLLMRGKRR